MKTATIKDADGVAHSYIFTYHPADEGLDIAFALGSRLAGPLTAAADALLPSLLGGSAVETLDDPDALRSALASPELGPAVVRALSAPGNGALVRQLLKYAIRDDAPLSNDATFRMAFAGNYSECMLAAWEAIQINRFFSLAGILPKPAKTAPK